MITPLQGRVVIRPIVPTRHGMIVFPDMQRDWDRKDVESKGTLARSSHRGRVLAMGEPARTKKGGAQVPYGFDVGAEVVYTFAHNEKNATQAWDDGEECVWIPQECVQAVIE
jgi:co-chaperonin GroES (HSP10)